MRTRRSYRNQEILWRELGGVREKRREEMGAVRYDLRGDYCRKCGGLLYGYWQGQAFVPAVCELGHWTPEERIT